MSTGSETVKVTITIEGCPEEVPTALRTLLFGHRGNGTEQMGNQTPCLDMPLTDQGTRTSDSQSLNAGIVGQSAQWTLEKLSRLWRGIAEGAREVLAEIATRPEGYPKEELFTQLDLDGRIVGGRLSSVGAVMVRLGFFNKVTKTGMEWPTFLDGVHYRMKP
jgi:hypothetical protein